jgi:hypothetical protein
LSLAQQSAFLHGYPNRRYTPKRSTGSNLYKYTI